MIPSKLKVVELRAELASRGLDTKGNKAALVDRLQEALDQEAKKGGKPKPESKEDSTPRTPAKRKTQDDENGNDGVGQTDQTASHDEEWKEEENAPKQVEESAEASTEVAPSAKEPLPDKPQEEEENMVAEREPEKRENEQEMESEAEAQSEDASKDEERAEVESTPQEPSPEMDVDVKPNISDVYDKQTESKPNERREKENLKHSFKEGYEVKTEPPEIKEEPGMKKMDTSEIKIEKGREDRKRKRSRSQSPRGGSFREQTTPMKPVKEEEPDIRDSDVTLSWYDSDLNLSLDSKTLYEATPMSDGGFGYIWAGARGTFAYTQGKLCYQVRLKENCNISHLEDEPNPNVLRVGWSALHTSMQLGEEPFSYGYGGTGKISENCKFENYGRPFKVGDVVTAYLEFTHQEFFISFAVNDEHFKTAWRVQLSDIESKKNWALAPHILTKNIKYEVNFGQVPPWTNNVKSDFTFLADFPLGKAIPGPQRPEKRSDCEMIMMCGLPACGKTTWANSHAEAHPEKHYNILGTNALIDKMKVMGLPRKANYSGRWDVLIERCTKCLQRLMDIGSHRRRNYILDQTNVYPAAQRRKMRNFEGFIRKAVVIVPTEEEFNARVQKQAQQERKDVPDSAVLEMKANFTLPDKNLFNEIIFTELQEAESKDLIHKYAKEAAAKGYTRKGPGGGGQGGLNPNKRFRSDFHQQNQRHDSYRRGGPHTPSGGSTGGGGGGGYRRGGGGSNSSSGGGGRGGWNTPRGGGGPDRWRDNRNHTGGSGGGFRQGSNDRSGGWRGGSSMGGGSSGRGPRDFGNDRGSRGGSYDRNSRGGSGTPNRQGGGGYNRDSRDNQRGKPKGGPRGGQPGGGPHGGSGTNMGTSGGSITASSNTQGGQWNSGGGQYQHPSGGNQQQPWANPVPQGYNQQQQQWGGNYPQQWKGYNQQGGTGGGYGSGQQASGYNQSGYNQQAGGYSNWQQYGYTGYGQQQNWQNSSEGNNFGSQSYPQTWQGWYAQSTGQPNTSQPPPTK